MKPFHELLDESAGLHGHLCPGQVLGVRMAMAGCRLLGIDEPKDTKYLIVYVEIDRCATDAIQSVTGCKLGKRTLKYVDYGKMAATFVNVKENIAFRVLARDDCRERAKDYGTPGMTKKEVQTQAYMAMDDEELFLMTPVLVRLSPEDMPGHPVSRVTCEECGEGVNDRRESNIGGRNLCRACANGAYYQPVETASQAKSDRTPPVVTIVGPSNSGKTRVAVALIEILTGRGYRIAAIKHCPHGHDTDRPYSDSDRLYQAGAATAIASSPDRRTLVERVDHDGSLNSLVSSVGPRVDLVIAEGFKGSLAPKILVTSSGQMAPQVQGVFGTVECNGEASATPAYTFEDMDNLATLIQRMFLAPP